MERFYDIAGQRLMVCCSDELNYAAKGQLDAFEIEPCDWDYRMNLDVVDELSPPEGELIFGESSKRVYSTKEGQLRYKGTVRNSLEGAYLRWHRRGQISDVQMKKSQYCEMISQKIVLDAMEAEHLIVANDGVLLHASYICYDNKAILFTAPSGTGKSTQAALWEKYEGAEVVNGDRVAIMITENGIMAYGIPFSGSSGICKNIIAPVHAIVYLEQHSENTVARMRGAEAFRALWEGCTIDLWDKEDTDRCIQTLGKIIQGVPVFKMKCTPDQTAVETLKQYIW